MTEEIWRPVVCYSMDGELIKEYVGGMDAARDTGICHTSIYKCCKGEFKQAGGYKWRYKDAS